MLILKLYLLTWICAVVAWVYTVILVDSEMLLFHWKGFLYKKIGKRTWLFKPLVDCSYCVSGQFAFWAYLYLVFFPVQSFDTIGYNAVEHIALMSFAIFNVALIKKTGLYGNKG